VGVTPAPPPAAAPAVDPFAPPDMARRAVAAGAAKGRLDALSLFTLAVLAGAFIALGAQLATLTGVGTTLGFGPGRLLAGVAFSLGLILVVIAGAELFTGNMLLVIAWLSGAATTRAVVRNWIVVYAGNVVGALLTAALVAASGQWTLADGRVGEAVVATAYAKLGLAYLEAVVRGVLGNALVCLAVWLCYSARSNVDKVVSIVPPIAAFVAGGFEHSVANMYFVPVALLLPGGTTAGLTWTAFVVHNLVPVTLGNMIGGVVFVGAVYWLVYLRPSSAGERPV
jgi:formate/nitrite transporter